MFYEVSTSTVGILMFGSRRFETVYNRENYCTRLPLPIQKLPIQWDRNLTHFEGPSKAMTAMSFWECATYHPNTPQDQQSNH